MNPPQIRRVGNLIISILDFLLSFIEASSIEAGVGNGDKKDGGRRGDIHPLKNMEIKTHYAAFYVFND